MSDAPNPSKNDKPFWEIAFQICVLFFGVLTTTCYALGRARLLGWHDNAGIPLLTFSWPFQEVVLHGFFAATNWLDISMFFAAILLIPGLTMLLLDAVTTYYKSLGKDLSLDQRCLRVRFIQNIDLAMHKESALELSIARTRYKVLGRRGMHRNSVGSTKKLKLITSERKLAIVLIFASYLVFVAFLVYLGAASFIGRAYDDGREAFRFQYISATGYEPASVDMNRDKYLTAKKREATEEMKRIAAERNARSPYAYIQVTENPQSVKKSAVCGWLVQSSDRQLLLLRPDGLNLLNFGDQPYRWRSVHPFECKPDEHNSTFSVG